MSRSSAVAIGTVSLSLSSLTRLPTVLVQSIMHSLDAREILALARTCTYTLQCASSAFAWSHCYGPPVSLQSGPPVSLQLLGWPPPMDFQSARTLRSFLPLSISADSCCLLNLPPSRLDAMLRFASAHRIVQLDFGGLLSHLSDSFRTLWNHAALRSSLRHVILHVASLEVMTLIVQLPRLHTVELWGRSFAAVSAPLVSAASLTSLDIVDPPLESADSFLPVLLHLTSLRTLRFDWPQLDESNFVDFCRSMCKLQHLDFGHFRPSWYFTLDLMMQWNTGIAALTSLQSLSFRWSSCYRHPFHALPPSLLKLSFRQSSIAESSLIEAMTANPRLSLHLSYPYSADDGAMFVRVAERFSGRVILSHVAALRNKVEH